MQLSDPTPRADNSVIVTKMTVYSMEQVGCAYVLGDNMDRISDWAYQNDRHGYYTFMRGLFCVVESVLSIQVVHARISS